MRTAATGTAPQMHGVCPAGDNDTWIQAAAVLAPPHVMLLAALHHGASRARLCHDAVTASVDAAAWRRRWRGRRRRRKLEKSGGDGARALARLANEAWQHGLLVVVVLHRLNRFTCVLWFSLCASVHFGSAPCVKKFRTLLQRNSAPGAKKFRKEIPTGFKTRCKSRRDWRRGSVRSLPQSWFSIARIPLV